MKLGPNHLSLTVSGAPGDSHSTPASVTAVECILRRTRAPARVTNRLSDLNALSGRHAASWGDIILTWSYDPETGVSAVFRDR